MTVRNRSVLLDDRICVATLFIFVAFEVLYAPLKVALYGADADFIFYLPRALMVIIPALDIALRRRISKYCAVSLLVLAVSVAVGMMHWSATEVAFGLYAFIPFMYCAYFRHRLLGSAFVWCSLALWAIAVGGVLVNWYVHFSWSGASVEAAGHRLMVSRESGTYGVARIAGLSVASWSASAQIMTLGLFLMAFLSELPARILIYVISLLAIFATTTKGGLYSFLAAGLCLLMEQNGRKIPAIAFLGVIALNVALPTVAYLVVRHYNLGGYSGPWYLSGETLLERMAWMWPQSMGFIVDTGGPVLGVGMGGIGAPLGMLSGQAPDFASADSLFVFGYALFGIGIVPLLLWLYVGMRKLTPDNKIRRYCRAMIMGVLLLGITTAPFERPVLMAYLSLAIWTLFDDRRSRHLERAAERTELRFSVA